MATTAPARSEPHVRDSAGFGGLVPCGAVARSGETLVAALGVEHHADGAALQLIVLSGAPGLIEWDPAVGLSVRDDLGNKYDGRLIASNSGLGQLVCTLWLEPAIPAGTNRLELVIDGIARVNPVRGGGEGISVPLSGSPWTLMVELVPERTVVEPPPEPDERRRPNQPGSVPARAFAAFVGIVPIGQARLGEGAAVCAVALERYWDRGVLTLAALGEFGSEAACPAIGRAIVDVWDDRGGRYRANPIQGAPGGNWSEVAIELLPALDLEATCIAVRVSEIPRGTDTARRFTIPGPFTFGVRLPAA